MLTTEIGQYLPLSLLNFFTFTLFLGFWVFCFSMVQMFSSVIVQMFIQSMTFTIYQSYSSTSTAIRITKNLGKHDTILSSSSAHDLLVFPGMYASRYGIRNLIIGAQPGGALGTSHCVENYPGTLSESGASIMKRFEEHAKHSGSDITYDTVVKIEELPGKSSKSPQLVKKFIPVIFFIYATGNAYRHLGVPGEDRLLGAGVSYCATCDGNFSRARCHRGWRRFVIYRSSLSRICVNPVKILVRKDKAKAGKSG